MEKSKKDVAVDTGLDLTFNVSAAFLGEWAKPYFGEHAPLIVSNAGLVIKNVLKTVIADLGQRPLSPNEAKKIKTVIDGALLEINSRLDGGQVPRDDGFFSEDERNRSNAKELFEGMLVVARDQHEEKKLEFLSYFYSNLVMQAEIPPTLANYFLRVFANLSYRQLVLLKYIADHEPFDAEPIRGRKHTLPDLLALTREEMELSEPGDFGGFGLVSGKSPYIDQMSDLGKKFVDSFQLEHIDPSDTLKLRQALILCEKSTVRNAGEEAEST